MVSWGCKAIWEVYDSTDFKFPSILGSSFLCASTFHQASRYALINFAFRALCLTSSSWHRLSPLPSPHPIHSSISPLHPSFLSIFFLFLSPVLSVPVMLQSLSLTPQYTHTHAYTLRSLKILSTIYHLQTQRSIANAGRGAKSILFDTKQHYGWYWVMQTELFMCYTINIDLNTKILMHAGA